MSTVNCQLSIPSPPNACFLLTSHTPCATIKPKVNTSFSAPGPVGLWGRIGNRVQLPSGTATVSAEAGAWGESLSLDFPRRHCSGLWMRKSGYLLRRSVYVRSCKYGIAAAFGAERRLRQFFGRIAAAFLMLWCCECGFPLTIHTDCPPKNPCVQRGGEAILPRFFKENLPRRSVWPLRLLR